MIFEAKTITDKNELHQSRAALAQLLEYRLEYGATDDHLCAVVNAKLSLRRARLLDELGVAVIYISSEQCAPNNDAGSRIVNALLTVAR
jgi:hypothetical protein